MKAYKSYVFNVFTTKSFFGVSEKVWTEIFHFCSRRQRLCLYMLEGTKRREEMREVICCMNGFTDNLRVTLKHFYTHVMFCNVRLSANSS